MKQSAVLSLQTKVVDSGEENSRLNAANGAVDSNKVNNGITAANRGCIWW